MIEVNSRVPTHFDNPVLVNLGGGTQTIDSNVEVRHCFINNLSVPITVVLRSGFRFTLPPEPCLNSPSLIARTEIMIRGKAIDSVARFMAAVNEQSTPELQSMREAFRVQTEHSHFTKSALIMLDYPITHETLRVHGGTVYYGELDMVISLDDVFNVCEHPYSQAGRDADFVSRLPIPVEGLSFIYAVSIIDSALRTGPRWINVQNQVYKVTPKRDSTRKDGVYIASSQPTDGDLGMNGLNVRRYPLDEADGRLGLYASAEEARNLGDMASAQKKKLLDLEGQMLEAKTTRELALLNQKTEYEALLAKTEKEKLELSQQKMAAEERQRTLEAEAEKKRIELKDLYEERSQRRKDGGEALKFLPNLIIGLGAVFLAFGRLSS